MKILLTGSGGREHAFAFKLSQSSICTELFIAPGNAGTSMFGENIAIQVNDFEALGSFCKSENIELIVVGPEDPLVNGMRDFFEADSELRKIAFVGPAKDGARMEGSKDWSKAFMKKYGIPTAAYETFTSASLEAGVEYIKGMKLPVVLKADGLAAGKGVLICSDYSEAEHELRAMITDAKFGVSGSRVVIEEYLDGIELSIFVLTDGESYKVLPSAKDYKRIGEGDKGLNTGGMGAVSPVPFADEAFLNRVESKIIIPTIEGLKSEGITYKGFIFIGLMAVNGEPYVIEYNCRMGDPETEVVLPRIQSDFAELMLATANGNLEQVSLSVSSESAATVMLVSNGYPGDYEKGKEISGIENCKGSIVFHAGTKAGENNTILSNGGRVLAVTTLAPTLAEALATSKSNAEAIRFENKYYRRDIGYEFV